LIDGSILIGGESRQREPRFQSFDAASGVARAQSFSSAGKEDLADACRLAANAAESFAMLSPETRAGFMEAVAQEIEAIGDDLIVNAMGESGLPRARLEGERARTINQLRLFASEVRVGLWLDITIDSALPDRVPPRPDLRRMNVPLGPVAVFGTSNFPLAFSVAGGDTASAFAAGCPVVVKGHPAHPATGERFSGAAFIPEPSPTCRAHLTNWAVRLWLIRASRRLVSPARVLADWRSRL
jgi:NADP-dependent aldehyde dehydrogenase